MTKNITLIALLFLCINFYGQQRRHQKLKEVKVSFLTSKLSLTSEQAEKFWPIYNEGTKNIFSNRLESQQLFRHINYENITEADATEHIRTLNAIEQSTIDIKRKLDLDFKNILSAKQILILKNSEVLFKRKLLERMKSHN